MQIKSCLVSLFILATRIWQSIAGNFENECTLKTTVSCYLQSDHRDCSNIIMKPNVCEDLDISFGFRYCNLHRHNSISFVSGQVNINHINFSMPLNQETELEPMHCKEFTKIHTVSSCAQAFEADMTAEGWMDNEVRCTSDDTFLFIRPLFEATS